MKRLLSVVIGLAVSSVLSWAQRPDIRQDIRNHFGYDATAYVFTRTNGQGASGDLSAAGTNVVTLTPCPSGVNGTDSNHYLWLSGGTGTAEAVQITGGTCTSGAQSGNIIIGTGYAHSGAWTLTSIADGIPEALQAAKVTRGTVYLAPRVGGYTVKAHAIVMPAYTGIECTDNSLVFRNLALPAESNTDGCTLSITGPSGSITGQTIYVDRGGRLKGLNFWYPNQENDPTPLQFPPTIKLAHNASPVVLENLYTANAYTFIDAMAVHGRLHVKNVQGQPISRGIQISNALDADLIENVVFIGPWYDDPNKAYTYPDATTAQDFIAKYGVGILVYRADRLTLHSVRIFGYNQGVRLTNDGTNGGSYGSATDFLCDSCQYSIYIDNDGIEASGWSFVNSELYGAQRYLPGFGSVAVYASGSSGGPLNIIGGILTGGATSALYLAQTDSTPIHFTNTTFYQWGTYSGAPAISLSGTGTASFVNCHVYAAFNSGDGAPRFIEYSSAGFTGYPARIINTNFYGHAFSENTFLVPGIRSQVIGSYDSNGLVNRLDQSPFTGLGTPGDGTFKYCTDCTAASSPCTGGGSGAFAVRQAGAWKCF